MSDVECVVDCQNNLGEGPAWSVDEQKLYWVDIEQSELRCYDPETGDTKVWQTPERVGCFAFREQGELIKILMQDYNLSKASVYCYLGTTAENRR